MGLVGVLAKVRAYLGQVAEDRGAFDMTEDRATVALAGSLQPGPWHSQDLNWMRGILYSIYCRLYVTENII